MADVLAEIDAAVKAGQVDDATLDRLLAAARAELATVQKAQASTAQNDARAQRLDAAQDETSAGTVLRNAGSEIVDTVGGKLKNLGRGAMKLGDMLNPAGAALRRAVTGTPLKENLEIAAEPIAKPEARREIGRGLSDVMLGYPAKISDAIRSSAGVEPTYAPNEEADAKAAPNYRTAATLGASVAPGSAVNLIGRGSMALASRLPLPQVFRALAAAQMGSGAYVGAHADTEDRVGGALEAAGDPINLVAPTGAAVANKVGQGGRALASKLRDDTSALGGGSDTLKALDTMRDEGRLSGNLRRTVKDPELQALPVGKKGYAKASQQARDKIGANASSDLKKVRADYEQEISAIEAEHADKAYGVEGLKKRLGRLRQENSVNGEPVDDQLGAALDKVDRMTTKKTGIMSADGGEIEAGAATISDLIKVKKAVGAKAQFGMPATPENRPYRLIWKELAQEAEGIDPRIKPLNEKYAQSMGKLEETNDILYGKEAPEVADRPAAKKRAAGTIMRADDDTTAGALGDENLDRLAELDTRNGKAIQKVKEKKAIERTRFGMPNMSKSPEKWGGVGMLEQNVDATRARVVDPLARFLGSMGIDPATQAVIRARLAGQQQENAQ